MTPDDTLKKQDPGVPKTKAALDKLENAMSSGRDLVLVPDQAFNQLVSQANPYWQQNLGMTTQVLPRVAGAQSFNAAALTASASVPDLYMSTHRQ